MRARTSPSPLAKLAAYAALLAAVFAGAYALGTAVPDLLDGSPPPAMHHSPATTMAGHP